MARYLKRGFDRRLATLQANPTIRQILVITHMPIFDVMIPTYPQSEVWSLLRAYMGNLALGEGVRACPKVTHVVSGHLHRGGAWQWKVRAASSTAGWSARSMSSPTR